jgi:molybdopterin converting factor small subunit
MEGRPGALRPGPSRNQVVATHTAPSPITAEEQTSAVTIRLFAGEADIAGARTVCLATEGPLTIVEAFLRLCDQFPALRAMEGRLLFAANAEYASPECRLQPGDELALIPPVSGGATS